MKLHKFDTLSFVAGIFIAGVGLIFLLPAEPGDLFDFFGGFDDITAWFWPTVFFAIGALVLLPLLLRRRDQGDDAGETADDLNSTL